MAKFLIGYQHLYNKTAAAHEQQSCYSEAEKKSSPTFSLNKKDEMFGEKNILVFLSSALGEVTSGIGVV